MAGQSDPIVATTLEVAGVRSEGDARAARQALFDVFAELGLGQATFEVTDADVANLIVKHKKSVTPDTAAIAQALADAGDFRLTK
ncbi:MAG TPA: hypothetical protein VK059_03670 [Nocardioidaceae bacterium]|nr:hypothetical protein [Nocardioidaceae bacterium]